MNKRTEEAWNEVETTRVLKDLKAGCKNWAEDHTEDVAALMMGILAKTAAIEYDGAEFVMNSFDWVWTGGGHRLVVGNGDASVLIMIDVYDEGWVGVKGLSVALPLDSSTLSYESFDLWRYCFDFSMCSWN